MTQDALLNGAAAASPAPTKSSTPPTPEQKAALNVRVSATFGQIVSILMRTPQHRHSFLADLEWLVLPAIASGQFSVAESHDKATGQSSPVAVAMWALVSEAVDRRLSSSPQSPLRLKPEEWNSGSIPWLIEVAGEPRSANALLQAVAEKRFPKTGLKTFARGPDGKPAIRIVRGEDLAKAGAAADGTAKR